MNRVIKIALFLNLLFVVTIVPSLWAAWNDNGVPLCTAPSHQEECQVTSDGAGGAIVAWEDYREGFDFDIYVQRIDATGTIQWTVNGEALCAAAFDQYGLQIESDGAGGALIVWADGRNGADDIYAGRIDASGSGMWGSGLPICTETGSQQTPQLTSDGAAGAIITWYDTRWGNGDIYAQRVDAWGNVLWSTNGDSICTAANWQEGPQIVSDGLGGAIMTWFDNRSGTSDIYAQRINASGTVLWTTDGVPLCTAADEQNWPRIDSDGAGGAIVSWHDNRSGSLDIYAQRIDASGSVQWEADGIPLCTATGDQWETQIVSDGTGGAIVMWQDGRSAAPGFLMLYAQLIDASGTVQWATDGVPLSTMGVEYNPNPRLISDGAGGAIATWVTWLSYDVYTQRVDSSGSIQWMVEGVLLCAVNSTKQAPRIASDGAGGAIISWQDDRSGESDIYAQQIDAQGRIGYLLPEIHSVSDVHGDEGGFVNLTWNAPRTDFLSGDITEYTVWRALETPAALGMLDSGAECVTDPTAALEMASMDKGGPVLRQASLNGEIFYWKLISSLTAYHLQGYSEIVPTLFDSTAVNDDYHYFQVIAHTDDASVFYVSEPDSGYSVDDLAPCFPAGVTGTQSFSPEGLWLTWNHNTEADFDLYNIYRDIGPSFDPGPGNLLLSTCETNTFDGEWSWDAGYCYKVTAVDIHGNESEYASVCAEQVTGDDPIPLPDATFLDQNFPNPFNPSTTIAFGLKESGHVSLRVYNASGRLVAELVDENRPSGSYTVEWNGRESYGFDTASGVYFYKLISKDFEETKKMILLR